MKIQYQHDAVNSQENKNLLNKILGKSAIIINLKNVDKDYCKC